MRFKVGDIFKLYPPAVGSGADYQNVDRVITGIVPKGYDDEYWMYWRAVCRPNSGGGVSDYRNALKHWKLKEQSMSEPLYKTLKELVNAVKAGTCPNGVLTLDNDSTTMYEQVDEDSPDLPPPWEDSGRIIFRGGLPQELLKEALDLLGVPNEPA